MMLRKLLSELRSVVALGVFNGFIPIKNNPVWFISFTLGPVSYIFLLYIIGREEAVPFAFVGGLIMTMAASGYGLIADIIWYRFNLKLQDMFISTPRASWAYVLGLALSAYIWALPSLVFFVVIGSLLGILRDLFVIGLIALLTIVLWINTSMFSFLLSTFLRTEKHVWPLATILGLGLSVFPPVYYPATLIPGELRFIALIPSTASSALILETSMNMIKIESMYLEFAVANIVLQTLLLAYLFKLRSVYYE